MFYAQYSLAHQEFSIAPIGIVQLFLVILAMPIIYRMHSFKTSTVNVFNCVACCSICFSLLLSFRRLNNKYGEGALFLDPEGTLLCQKCKLNLLPEGIR